MPEHQTPLITTISGGLVLAYVFGLLAHRLRIQPLVGYLLAGIVVGPFTPGFVAHLGLATELAEIGIILLMFGVVCTSRSEICSQSRISPCRVRWSILLNPLLFSLVERRAPAPAVAHEGEVPREDSRVNHPQPAKREALLSPDHDVVVGYGRVGSVVGERLLESGHQVLIIEDGIEAAEKARRDGAQVVSGNAAHPGVLELADLETAARLYVTIPEAFGAGQIVEQARAARPELKILVRAHSQEGVQHLDRLGATLIIQGEEEIARRMLTDQPKYRAPRA